MKITSTSSAKPEHTLGPGNRINKYFRVYKVAPTDVDTGGQIMLKLTELAKFKII